MAKYSFLVLNGPNLNLLGSRETSVYGENTLAEIESFTSLKLKELGFNVELDWIQTNVEGEIVNHIQSVIEKYDGLIINPAGYSHSSIAILDALRALTVPVSEVHISKVSAREDYRRKLITAEAAATVVEGADKYSYALGVMSLIFNLSSK